MYAYQEMDVEILVDESTKEVVDVFKSFAALTMLMDILFNTLIYVNDLQYVHFHLDSLICLDIAWPLKFSYIYLA